jgi:hypothetical protein
MTDPRDTMLNAARALHERGETDPRFCDTCTDSAGHNPVYWPCPTATALGATGRSEWHNTPNPCATGCPPQTVCDDCQPGDDRDACGAEPPNGGEACRLPDDHPGYHANGKDNWEIERIRSTPDIP